jgi:hypothetical protein
LLIPSVSPGTVGPCPVAPDALQGIVRQQTNLARWNGAGWDAFVADLRAAAVRRLPAAEVVVGERACRRHACCGH